MGYYTRVFGEIEIDPPLSWAEIQDNPDLRGQDRECLIRVVEESVETPDGTLIRREGVAIVPCTEDSFKAYNLIEHVQHIVSRFDGPHTFSGRFDCEGEEAGDIWRLEVHDGKAVPIKPRIEWPNGEVQVGRR